MNTANQLKSQQELWKAAIKIPMYSVAVIPITLGTAIALSDFNLFDYKRYIIFLFSGILIIAWMNLSNDVFDSETGIDKNKAHSIVNLTNNKLLIFWVSNVCLILGILGILIIAWMQKDPTILWLSLLGCFLGYCYQGPPFRLGYYGLGEIICFINFGPLGLSVIYYSQAKTFSTSELVSSIIIGITTSIILFCSHFHQLEDDLSAGKKSPVVRLGTQRASSVLSLLTLSVFILTIIFVCLKLLPIYCLLFLISFPWAYKLITHVRNNYDLPEKISNSKFMAVSFHFFSGILLTLGFILNHYFSAINDIKY